jgi:hypothetical protein
MASCHVTRCCSPRTQWRRNRADYFDHLDAARLERYHVQRLEQLGFTVTLTPQAA